MKVSVTTLLTVVFLATTIMQGYLNYSLNVQNHELTQQNQRLQAMMYDYAPAIFVYPKDPFNISLKYFSGFGKLKLTVVVITPHNGYMMINQTSFKKSNDAERLAREHIRVNDVAIEGLTIIAVSQGSNEKSIEIPFKADIKVDQEYIQPGRSGTVNIGDVNLLMIYFDIQSEKTYSKEISLPVSAIYEY